MKLAVVLVHYFTPELARRACEALLQDASSSDLTLELVLVDNGSRPEDLAGLKALPTRYLGPKENLGYAGGANLGIGATTADLVVVMNPDVLVLPGCLRALGEELDDGAAVAGPRFYWDASKRFQLPPTETVGRWSELLRVLALRGDPWVRWARRQWRRHARRHWLATEPIASTDLSGALLAFRRATWEQVGPFDEGYRLYFEETDWLQRLERSGLVGRFVPAAEAVHLYAQSTASEGQAQSWFLESNRRFRRRVYGASFTRLLEFLSPGNGATRAVSEASVSEASDAQPTDAQPTDAQPTGFRVEQRAAWLEVAPLAAGFPAAGQRLEPGSQQLTELPQEIKERLAPGTYTLRSVAANGRTVSIRTLVAT